LRIDSIEAQVSALPEVTLCSDTVPMILAPAQVPAQGVDAQALGDNRCMDRIVKRAPKRQQQASDLAYWLSRPMAERIAAVEVLREQASMPPEHSHAEPRLQRVCRIAQRQGR